MLSSTLFHGVLGLGRILPTTSMATRRKNAVRQGGEYMLYVSKRSMAMRRSSQRPAVICRVPMRKGTQNLDAKGGHRSCFSQEDHDHLANRAISTKRTGRPSPGRAAQRLNGEEHGIAKAAARKTRTCGRNEGSYPGAKGTRSRPHTNTVGIDLGSKRYVPQPYVCPAACRKIDKIRLTTGGETRDDAFHTSASQPGQD